MPRIVEYVREDGSNPYRDWFARLDPQAAAKIVTAAMRLGFGYTSNLKRIGAVTEYRIDWGPGYRIYMARDGDAMDPARRRYKAARAGGHRPSESALRGIRQAQIRRPIG